MRTIFITAATIDRVASETLAKVEEKCPIITKTPTEVKFVCITFPVQLCHSYGNLSGHLSITDSVLGFKLAKFK